MAGLINLVHVEQALALRDFDSTGARKRMSPIPRGWRKRQSAPAQAAVMVLLYHDREERLHVALTLRHAGLRGHSGQVSFPGGRRDPEDKSLTETAIRETGEEIGICREMIRVLGEMPRLYIPTSHHDVYPTVGYCERLPRFRPNPQEVAEVFSFALEDLLHPRFRREERRMIGGYDVWAPYYAVGGHKVWGATAIMLSELEERLRRVLPRGVLLALG